MHESDSEDEGADRYVKKTTFPAVPADSTLLKKRRRYIAWNANPGQMGADLAASQEAAERARTEFKSLELDEERWAECVEIARRKIHQSHQACVEYNSRLAAEAKQLYGLIVAECGSVVSTKKVTHLVTT